MSLSLVSLALWAFIGETVHCWGVDRRRALGLPALPRVTLVVVAAVVPAGTTRTSTKINAGKKEHTANAFAYHEADADKLMETTIESGPKTSTVILGQVRSSCESWSGLVTRCPWGSGEGNRGRERFSCLP